MHIILMLLLCLFTSNNTVFAAQSILNVSYDSTRKLYQDINKEFYHYYKNKYKEKIRIYQSHGGSGKQARAVLDGLQADIVTLATSYDVDILSEAGLVNPNWRDMQPNKIGPYTSTIVFLVRKYNPKRIHDFDDLVRPDVEVITSNPKTSGAAKWSYIASWNYAMKKYNDEERAKDFMRKLYSNVPVFDVGARAATVTFINREIGDVLITWENEAYLINNVIYPDNFEIVYPETSVLIELPVAMVDKVVEKKKTQQIAKEYIEFLYSDVARRLIIDNYYRVNYVEEKGYYPYLPKINTFTIDEYGGWHKFHDKHFAQGKLFDQIYETIILHKNDKKL